LILVTLGNVPAIATAIAGDIGGSGAGSGQQTGRAGNGTKYKSSDFPWSISMRGKPPPDMETAEPQGSSAVSKLRLKQL
jgi:hypothetical protein